MKEVRNKLRSHRLGIEHFGRLIGTTHRCITKYEKEDKTLTEVKRIRIEAGLRALDRCPELVYPAWDNYYSVACYEIYRDYKRKHFAEVKRLDEEFGRLFEEEMRR